MNEASQQKTTINNGGAVKLTKYYPIIFVIVALIIIIIITLASGGLTFSKIQSNESAAADVFIVLTFIFIILILCFTFLPSYKEISKLFNQISNVTFVILYTIFLILFFRLLPTDILNNYANYIVPITLIAAFVLFFFAFKTKYILDYDLNYERIKIIIMFFCFITLSILYYSTDPGKIISKYFGVSLLLTLLIGVMSFIYLITLLTLPESYGFFQYSEDVTNSLKNITPLSKYGSILFFLFLIVMTIIFLTYPGGFFKNKNVSTIVFPLFLIVSVLWCIILVLNGFTGSSNINKSLTDSKLTLMKKSLITLLGFIISGLVITYLIYSVQTISGRSGIASFILSLFLIISILILIYKTIFVRFPSNNANKSKSGFFDLIINLIFYIPCLFSVNFDGLMKMLISEYNSTTMGNVIILLITIGLFLIYIFLPKIQHLFNLQGGKELVSNPIYTNSFHSLANYEQLNGNDNFDYQYSISFWVFIDSNAPNTNPSYNQYTSLLNYGGKPNVLYKADTNTLMITMDQKDLDKKSKNKLLEFDDHGNRIIYTNKNILLQKWNNIVINFNGGTLDIFLNGELVKSSIEVIPYMQLDTLTVGSDGGVNGGICNVVYFKNPLSITNIYYIYQSVKNKSPPVANDGYNTIIKIT
jgi:hypothetical protein